MLALRIGRCRVLEHLARIGMSQAEYALRIDVSESFVSKVIKNKRKLSLIKGKMSAELFGCTIDDLYTWENYSSKRQ